MTVTFDELGVKKLPTVRQLQDEYQTVLDEKKRLLKAHRNARGMMRELSAAKRNADILINIPLKSSISQTTI